MGIKTRETRQKEIIGSLSKKFMSFFTAEELFSKVREKDKRIGIATIYRFLKQRSLQGKIHSYYCDRKLIYSVNNHGHSHFICTKCEKTTHIRVRDINFIRKDVRGSICHFQIDVYGVCENCIKKS